MGRQVDNSSSDDVLKIVMWRGNESDNRWQRGGCGVAAGLGQAWSKSRFTLVHSDGLRFCSAASNLGQ